METPDGIACSILELVASVQETDQDCAGMQQAGVGFCRCGSITSVATPTVAPDFKESGEPTVAPVDNPTESGKPTPSTEAYTTSESVASSGAVWGLSLTVWVVVIAISFIK
jgi:hypothetical protein